MRRFVFLLVLAGCDGGGTTTTVDGPLPSGTSTTPTDPNAPNPFVPGSSSSSGSPGSLTDDAGAKPTIYCGANDSKTCACGQTAEYGTLGASCSTSTVESPGICCADTAWPHSAFCMCTTFACDQYSSDTCICGAAGTVEHPVGSCSPPPGGVCCMGQGAFGTSLCSCHKDLKQCPPDEQPVSSCTVASALALGCGRLPNQQALQSCN